MARVVRPPTPSRRPHQPDSEVELATAFLRRKGLTHLHTRRDGDRLVLASKALDHARIWQRAPRRWGGEIFSVDEWFAIGVNDVYPTLRALLEQLIVSYPHALAPAGKAKAAPRAPARPRLPSFDSFIDPLTRLDLRGLTPSLLGRQCAANGWTRELSTRAFARYRLSQALALDVNPRPKISFAWVTLLTWADWEESDYPKRSGFAAARKRFDARFEAALAKLTLRLGEPRSATQETDLALRRASWPLRGGDLVLLQSDRDLAEGLTLELRLVPRRRTAGECRELSGNEGSAPK